MMTAITPTTVSSDELIASRRVPEVFRAQATQVFENLKIALASARAGFEHVVKLNSYLTDIPAQLPTLRDVRENYLNKAAPPASTTVQERAGFRGLAALGALAAALATVPDEARAVCSVLSHHPCTPGFGSVLSRHPYTPGFCGRRSSDGQRGQQALSHRRRASS